MQIISGAKRGKKLVQHFNSVTRPTTNRVRENIFNVIVAAIRDAAVLDLFAGTGAYGVECCSRGAREVIFNDSDKTAVQVIKKNCALVGCVTSSGTVLNLDFLIALEKLKNKKFDLVFLDPPYDSNFGEESIQYLYKNKMLKQNSIIVFETEKDGLEFEDFDVKIKKYGRARIYFLTLL